MVAEEVLYHITGINQFGSTNVDDLSTIVRQYPFFSPAQFLLALKQKKDNSYNYQYQLQKASLYFSNQVWLNYQLNEKEIAVPDLQLIEPDKIIEHSNTVEEENIFPTSILGTTNYAPIVQLPKELATDEESHKDLKEEITDETETSFDYSSLFTNSSNIEVPTLEAVKEILGNNSGIKSEDSDPSFPSILKEPIATVTSPTRIPSFSFTAKNEDEKNNELADALEGYELNSPSSFFTAPSIVPEILEPIENIESKESLADSTITTEIEHSLENIHSDIPSYSFKGFAEDSYEHANDAVSISEAYANRNHEEEGGGEEETDNSIFTNNISSLISNQVEGFKKPVEKHSKFEFENENNLHTVDYFASQGIKIDLTKIPQDKLTVQMRRFTDWLKQIKKTDPNPQDLGTDPELEKAIENIAKTSIEAKEIVTETMADVFVKQGKVNKAIQLYIKLSFLDPTKSTYFAAKIQQLKGI
jgi:hypothetical protein